ncbi:MAG: response regulator [Desulfatibacillaceae bacterium]|nr:response regulator [Desulfatibacillaceae bacterium]
MESPKRVMVVEDNEPNRQLLKDLLEMVFVCTVEAVEDGEKAVEITGKNPPDLILMDVSLPGMDGVEAMLRIKKQHPQGSPPCLALTGYAAENQKRALLAEGFDGFLPKPFDVPQLLETLSVYLERK